MAGIVMSTIKHFKLVNKYSQKDLTLCLNSGDIRTSVFLNYSSPNDIPKFYNNYKIEQIKKWSNGYLVIVGGRKL